MRPTSRRVSPWVNYSADEIETLVVRLAKDGMGPSQIGVKLRDEYNIPLVKSVFGRSITEILEENGVKSSIPEDLEGLLMRAKRLREHLSIYRSDRKNIRSLELIEAKIHRLSRYYKRRGLLPTEWKYSTVVAQLA